MLKSTKENNLYYKSREEILNDIFDRREFDWREKNTTDNYPLLSWEDYRFIFDFCYSKIPTYTEYWNYRAWCFANGFMPYGGESTHEPDLTYELAKIQIKEEAKAAALDFFRWLDKNLDMG